MKKYSNRFLSLALAAVMVVSTALPAFAEDAPLNAAGQDAAVEAQADAAAQAAAQAQAEAEAQAAAQAQAAAEAQAAAQAQAEAEAQAAAQAQAEAEAQAAAQAQAEAAAQAEAEAQAAAQAEAPEESEPSEEAPASAGVTEPAASEGKADKAAPAGDEKAEEAAGQAASPNELPAPTAAPTSAPAPVSETAEADVQAPAADEGEEIKESVPVRNLLMAFVLNGAAPFDNSTTLPDGIYTPDDYVFTGGTGKARYDCESVKVTGGKATALLVSSSASATHVALRHSEAESEDISLYDPATNAVGTNVYAVTNKRVEIPVVLNQSMPIASRTTAMGNPHWINYTITITVNEPTNPEEEDFDNSTDLPDGTYIPSDYVFTGGTGKARYDCEKVIVRNGKATALMVSTSASATHVSLRHSEETAEDTALYDPATGKTGKNVYALSDKKVEIPVKLNTDMPIAGRTTAMSNPHWINYVIHITVTEEDRLDEDVFYNVTVKVTDSGTGKEISGAKVTVTDSDKAAVTAENGVYTLTGGQDYTVKAEADGYEAASQSYTASKDETLTIKLTKKSSSGESGKTGNLKIVKNAAMFKVVSASLEGSGSSKKLRIALSGQGYQYLYKGTKEDAAVSKASERIKGKKNAAGKWEFVIPVTAKDGTFALAALSSSKNAWYDRTIILDQKKMTISTESADPTTSVPVPDGEDWRGDSGKQKEAEEAKKKEAESYKDASNVGTSAVNNSTTLADGTYGPSDYSFSFSGGTGKVVIVCTQVVVKGGQAYATLKFQKPNGKASSVDTVRASGSVFGGNNVFEIPVQLNANNTIVARTTAMSQPHWIEYKIFINMKEPGKDSGSGVGKDTKTMDDEAPEIVGLTVKDETEVVYSDRFKIFNYEDGIYLIEVDMISDTAREDVEDEEAADEADAADSDEADAAEPAEDASTSTAAAAGDGISTAEEEAAPAVSESAETAELYTHDIVKYLVVPSDAEIPAGLGKEVIVIEQPVDKTYVSSAGALELLADIGVLDDIRTIGVEEKDITVDSVLEALEPRDPDGVPLIEFGGTYDDWDLKSMIIKQTNFAVQSSAFLPKDEKTFDDDMENFERLTNRSAQMGFACFVDRSEDEENDLARAEWYKVYGIIFNKLKEGEAAYKKVVDAASASEKKAALDLLKKRAEERKVRLDDEAEEEADD